MFQIGDRVIVTEHHFCSEKGSIYDVKGLTGKVIVLSVTKAVVKLDVRGSISIAQDRIELEHLYNSPLMKALR